MHDLLSRAGSTLAAFYFMSRPERLAYNTDKAISEIDKALALLTRLEPGNHDTETHPDVVQARSYLAKALRQLGGRS
jgi:hypothetical protein